MVTYWEWTMKDNQRHPFFEERGGNEEEENQKELSKDYCSPKKEQ